MESLAMDEHELDKSILNSSILLNTVANFDVIVHEIDRIRAIIIDSVHDSHGYVGLYARIALGVGTAFVALWMHHPGNARFAVA
jgi:hypothetical protein